MGVNLENFNRIIDLQFIPDNTNAAVTETLKSKSILCPRYGRKPDIEINGTFGAALTLQPFDIMIKNLYVDYRTENFAGIKIRAGYANNYTTFDAAIISMYQDMPGPEGTTVIQCACGEVIKNWLDSTVSLKFETNAKLTDILSAIKSKLMISQVDLGKTARTLTLKEPLQYDGVVRGALALLEKRFSEYKLQIIMQGSVLCAICVEKGDFINSRRLQFMSAPPQKNPGDEDGSWNMMITAPWMPDLMPGDLLEIPNQIYYKNFNVVGSSGVSQKMEVQTISFHFSTRKNINQMTCSGFIVR